MHTIYPTLLNKLIFPSRLPLKCPYTGLFLSRTSLEKLNEKQSLQDPQDIQTFNQEWELGPNHNNPLKIKVIQTRQNHRNRKLANPQEFYINSSYKYSLYPRT